MHAPLLPSYCCLPGATQAVIHAVLSAVAPMAQSPQQIAMARAARAAEGRGRGRTGGLLASWLGSGDGGGGSSSGDEGSSAGSFSQGEEEDDNDDDGNEGGEASGLLARPSASGGGSVGSGGSGGRRAERLGFDRLRAHGLSRDEVRSLRVFFGGQVQAHAQAAGPAWEEARAGESERRRRARLEEAWIDAQASSGEFGLNFAAPGGAGAGGAGGGGGLGLFSGGLLLGPPPLPPRGTTAGQPAGPGGVVGDDDDDLDAAAARLVREDLEMERAGRGLGAPAGLGGRDPGNLGTTKDFVIGFFMVSRGGGGVWFGPAPVFPRLARTNTNTYTRRVRCLVIAA